MQEVIYRPCPSLLQSRSFTAAVMPVPSQPPDLAGLLGSSCLERLAVTAGGKPPPRHPHLPSFITEPRSDHIYGNDSSFSAQVSPSKYGSSIIAALPCGLFISSHHHGLSSEMLAGSLRQVMGAGWDVCNTQLFSIQVQVHAGFSS